MLISEGVLSAPVLAAGWGLAAAGLALGLKKTKAEDLPRGALVSAVLFLASLIHVPVGPSSVHLTLLGRAGIVLGWGAVPSLFIALLLQSFLFQFGGLLSLGVNTALMGTAALAGFYIYGSLSGFARKPRNSASQARNSNLAGYHRSPSAGGFAPERRKNQQTRQVPRSPPRKVRYVSAFLSGFMAVITGSALVAAALFLSDKNLAAGAGMIFAANAPLAIVEGVVTMFAVVFLSKIYPQALAQPFVRERP
jgi:cobalt/nickel transport system permease protein